MRFVGEALAHHGFPVRAVRLAGHGTRAEDLVDTRWSDWFASAREGLEQMREEGRPVAVLGMSMGALLALHAAAVCPDAVAGLVLCGTPLFLPDVRLRWLPLLARVPGLGVRTRMFRKTNGADIGDPAMRAASRSYPMMPLAAVVELLRLQATVRAELARITQPTLLLHGRHDHSVPVANLELLRRKLGSRVIEAHVLERSWHVITVDRDRDELVRLTAAFLGRLEEEPRADRAS